MGESLSKSKREAPPTVSSDKVVPLGCKDDIGINRAVIMNFMMRFDDVLDPEKLRLSLEKLLSRDDWRKLGARLRLNDQGKLDYHIPAQYDEKRPAVAFSHVSHDIAISQHPLGSRLPRVPAKPAVVGDATEFDTFLRRPDGPKELADYLYRDEPQISMHVTSFGDATLVALSWAHTFLDALGRRALFDAWCAVLDGREGDVLPLQGADSDPLADIGSNPTEPYKLADRRLGTLQMIGFGIRYAWDLLWHRGDETRQVCIPASYLKDLHSSALEELRAQAKGGEKPFVSEGDVICAWISRFWVLHHPPTSNRTIMLMNPFSLRALLAEDTLPADQAYVHNAVTSVWAPLTVRDIASRPLSFVASQVRKSIAEQGTRGQVEARLAIDRDAYLKGTGPPAMFGDATMDFLAVSNWTKAKFFTTDFSAAVVRPGADPATRTNKIGTPSHILPGGFAKGMSLRNGFYVAGKDAEGNVWLGGTLRKGLWAGITKAIEESA